MSGLHSVHWVGRLQTPPIEESDGGPRPLGPERLNWRALPQKTRLYLAVVIAAGACATAFSFPTAYPRPALFVTLLLASCVMSAWKVNLPISLASGSTLSMSYAANLMSLLLLGPRAAVIISVAGALTQCMYKVKQAYPLYRTAFSGAAEAITMVATDVVYLGLGGPIAPLNIADLPRPLVGAIGTYFFVNTGLVAAAIALSTTRSFFKVWRDDFLWSGVSFMVAGTAGALAAVIVDRGHHWGALLVLAPMHLTYRTYQLFVGRVGDQMRHTAESQRLLEGTENALRQTREAQHALLDERERLANALAEMTSMEETRSQLLEREQAARAGAEQANRLKDEFLAVVSHELRTPLNAILGWAGMLRRGKLDEPRRELASLAIFRSAKRQAQLIDDLLDVARIMSGKLRLEQRAVDFGDTVREALQMVQPDADAKRIALVVDEDGSIGPIRADPTRLQQIVWNLLSNAIKFTPEGGSVHLRLRQIGTRAELMLTDTGQGISPDFLPAIFAPFRQGDASITRSHGGLGLGLSIVKHLVEAHEGTVTARSGGEGLGATFIVQIPAGHTFDDPSELLRPHVSSAQENRNEPSASLAGISVLIVDDDDESREVVAMQLEYSEASVLTARSAAEAYDLLLRKHVDVLLADIAMPDEDGYSLVRRMRASGASALASMPAAALTALAHDEDRARTMQAGFQLHLAKPIDSRVLVAAVAHLANGARLCGS